MSEDEIIDYSRQSIVNRVFAVVVIALTAFAILWKYSDPEDPGLILPINMLIPVVLLFVSFIMGASSKRAIDYIPGEWAEQKVWMSFPEYEKMFEQYEDAFGHLFSHSGDCCSMCILIPVAIALGWLTIIFESITESLFSPFIDSVLLIIIVYSIVAAIGFILGFRFPAIDAEEFFKPVQLGGDVYDFASELQHVNDVRAGLNVTLGTRANVQTIKTAEIKTYVEGLPDTVAIQVQVSHSGFAYPYLVGTAYKGTPVTPGKERFEIGTQYPALMEYSMDGEVAVMVARFDIPKRTSAVPHISDHDFRRLAVLLVSRLKANHEGTL